jgi:ABC-type Fe3+-hydroxamate transport system substrate-binding protein
VIRNSFGLVHPREALWLVPFVCLGIIALGLFRPQPKFPAPAQSRIVRDETGKPVQIAVPFRGVAVVGSTPDGYLMDTHAPEFLVHAGDPDGRKRFAGLMESLVYPEVLKKDSLWDAGLFKYAHGPYAEFETLLAYDPGVFLGYDGGFSLLTQLRNFDLPVLADWGHQKTNEQVGFSVARVDSALIGHPELGEARIASYRRVFADLEKELQPSLMDSRPSVLTMAASSRDRTGVSVARWRQDDYFRAGMDDASQGWAIRGDDAERILAMDPDIVILMGTGNGAEGPREFLQDPRWFGLKATESRRVYKNYGVDALKGNAGLTFSPVEVRWMAEIAHPDRLQPRVRQLSRERMYEEFGYLLNEDQIDYLLQIKENSDSIGVRRFIRNYQSTSYQRSSK